MILPKPFSDESLASLLARLCRLNGISDYGDVVTLLFGHGLHTTFINAPVDVVEFCVRTKGAYGEPVEVLENLTWMGAAGRLEVASPSRGTYVAAGLVKPTLAEMTFPESVSLRYCPACRKRDLLGYGMSYWRRQHQIPIVWYCADHGESLVKVPMKRADLHTTCALPGDFKRLDSACVARRHAPGDFMQAVAHLVRDFFACPAPPSPALIHASIVSELRARRLLSDRGRLHLSEFSAQLPSPACTTQLAPSASKPGCAPLRGWIGPGCRCLPSLSCVWCRIPPRQSPRILMLQHKPLKQPPLPKATPASTTSR